MNPNASALFSEEYGCASAQFPSINHDQDVGKPNYFFSTEPEGSPVNSVPEGFEIYKNIGGQVSLRRNPNWLVWAVSAAKGALEASS